MRKGIPSSGEELVADLQQVPQVLALWYDRSNQLTRPFCAIALQKKPLTPVKTLSRWERELEQKIPLRQRQARCWFAGQHLAIGLDNVGLWIDLQVWQIGVVHHGCLAQTTATAHGHDALL